MANPFELNPLAASVRFVLLALFYSTSVCFADDVLIQAAFGKFGLLWFDLIRYLGLTVDVALLYDDKPVIIEADVGVGNGFKNI